MNFKLFLRFLLRGKIAFQIRRQYTWRSTLYYEGKLTFILGESCSIFLGSNDSVTLFKRYNLRMAFSDSLQEAKLTNSEGVMMVYKTSSNYAILLCKKKLRQLYGHIPRKILFETRKQTV